MAPKDASSERHRSERDPLLSPDSTSPLLGPSGDETKPGWTSRLISHLHIPKFDVIDKRYRFIPLLGCLVVFSNESEYYFKQSAMMRAVESLFCIEHYNVEDPEVSQRYGRHIPEQMCKTDDIQKNVAQAWAIIMGGRMVFAMIGAFPLGRLADTWGRKPILMLHKAENVLFLDVAYPKIPIWGFYLGSVAGIIGGNFDLGLAVLFATYTDVLTDDAQRTTLFFLTSSMQFVAQMIIPPIGGMLMNLDGHGGTPIVALVVGLVTAVWILILTWFIPETLKKKRKEKGPDEEHDDHEHTGTAQQSKVQIDTPKKQGLKAKFSSALTSLRNGSGGIDAVDILAIAWATVLVGTAQKMIDMFGILQYPVVRMGWSYAQAAIIPSIMGVLTLFTYSVFVPTSTHFLTKKFHLAGPTATTVIMAFSVTTLCTGSLLMGFGSTPAIFFPAMAIYVLGAGFSTSVQSYLAGMIPREKLGSVLAILSMGNTGGKIVASIAWPNLLSKGLEKAREGKGEVWRGLPMFSASTGFLGASLGVAIICFKHWTSDDQTGKGKMQNTQNNNENLQHHDE